MSAPAPAKVDVPVVSFRVISDDKSLLGPAVVNSEQARTFGYNDFSYFERPEHYIRYIEPIESELAVQVEYDMDEQDQEWLDAVNAERKKDGTSAVSYEVFEIIMDKLEKEWFNLIKRIPQPVSHLPVEDSKCAICDDGEGENSNAIVFCDGCNLAVHQDCYGVPYIPEGQWLCRKCTVSPENPVSCLFCPNEGGAFKQTTTGLWSHLLCAIWIPELGVGNSIYMEPVEGVENVPKSRWKLHCSLCKERVGACIQCEKSSCFTAFHVTCARQAGLLMSMKLMGADGQLKAFCDKHLPADWRLAATSEADEEDESWHDTEDDEEDEGPRKRKRKDSTTTRPATITTKSARAHTKSYRPGPPIVPRMIVNRLLEYVSKVSFAKRQVFIERLCRYWSLKREARRGAPLLKRLHLEPWTATTESRDETEAEKAKKLEFLVSLRNDLEKVRLLAELVRKREKEKLRQAQVIKGIVEGFVFPNYAKLRSVYERIAAMDKEEIFTHPVDPEEVPDYYEVIKEPICFSEIDDRIENVKYTSVDQFKNDIELIFFNAQTYNKSDTPFFRRAAKIRAAAGPILAELDSIPAESALLPEGDFVQAPEGTVGDLETSLVRLQALLAPDQSEPGRDLLASIFVSEVAKKEPTPPPPRAKSKSKSKEPKASSPSKAKTLRTRRFEEQEARYRERLAMGGGRSSRRGGGVSSPIPSPLPTAAEPPAPSPAPAPTPEAGPSSVNAATPSGTPRRRTRRSAIAKEEEEEDVSASAASSPGAIKPMKHPQRGVAGLQSFRPLTHAERRAKERKLDLVTTSLDAKHQNERFNVGWILPEGSKRRRTEASTSTSPKTTTLKSLSKEPKEERREGRDRSKKGKGKAPATPRQSSKSTASRPSTKRKAAEPEPQEEDEPEHKRARTESDDDDLTPVPESAPPTTTEFNIDRSSLSPLPEDMETPKASAMRLREETPEALAEAGEGLEVDAEPAGEEMDVVDQEGGEGEKVGADEAEAEVEQEAGAAASRDVEPSEEKEEAPNAEPKSADEDVANGEPPNAQPEANSQLEVDTLPEADALPETAAAAAAQDADADRAETEEAEAEAKEDAQADTPEAPAAGSSEPGPSEMSPSSPRASHSATPKPRGPQASSSKVPRPTPNYRPGMQVWAKVKSFPYFPARIVDPVKDWKSVPQMVLDLENAASSKGNGPLHLVQFYDKGGTWGWINADKLDTFPSPDDDVFMMGKEPGNRKKVKVSSHFKREVKKAYADAMAAQNKKKKK